MTQSANELEMLAQKAARGAGAYPAQAAHFGKVLVCHLVQNRPINALISALNALPDGPIQLLPIRQELSKTDPLEQSYADLRIPPDQRTALPDRIVCPADLHAHLTELAERTFVPDSAASRAAGAGPDA